MKYCYDLQTHSSLSDGDFDIKTVISRAKKAGLKGISITDHNTWKFLDKKSALAEKAGLEYVAGLEISTKLFETEIHILGYARKFDLKILKKGLAGTINGYNARAREIIAKLKRHGIKIDWQDLKIRKGKDLGITRYDIAKYLAPKMKKSAPQVQKELLGKGGIGYAPYGDWAMTPQQAVTIIRRAGGLAVLSHPGETFEKLVKRYGTRTGEKKFKTLLKLLLKFKINGLEINTPKNSPKIKRSCQQFCARHGLLETGGSDWHGEIHHPELSLGSGGLAASQFIKLLSKINTRNLTKKGGR